MEAYRKVSAFIPYKTKNGKVYIFLQKRAKNARRAPGMFGFFGGGIEEGETAYEALLREVKEELDFVPNKEPNLYQELSLPVVDLSFFTLRVDDDFESKIKILEGDYGKWFSEEDYIKNKDLITGEHSVLDKLYMDLIK